MGVESVVVGWEGVVVRVAVALAAVALAAVARAAWAAVVRHACRQGSASWRCTVSPTIRRQRLARRRNCRGFPRCPRLNSNRRSQSWAVA